MKVSRKLVAAFACAALASTFAFVGCSSSSSSSSASSAATEDSTVIRVGAVPTPHAEILEEVVKPALAEQGYDLEVVEFNDYVLPNTALDAGEIDANYFQHVPYLEDFNAENGTDLVSVVPVHFEPFGVYAGTSSSIDEVKAKIADGEEVTISVPNDTTNEARALLLLQDEGIITLPEDAGLDVTAIDIIDKPANLKISELEAAQVARSLNDVDVACINGNYAQEAGLDVNDAIAVESSDSLAADTYANVLVVNAGDEDKDSIKALAEILNSDAVRDYIEQHYGNAVIAVF